MIMDGFDIGFLWVMVATTSVIVSVIAVLRVLLNAGMNEEHEDEYAFSKNALANYNHSFGHEDAVTLQTNSLMIELHETLLAQLDKEARQLTCKVIMKRMLGSFLCLILFLLSALGIVGLINYETEVVRNAAKIHSSMETIGQFIVPFGVAIIKAITPHVVKRIVLFENYTAEFLFQQTFFRVYMLRIGAILVTLFQTEQTVGKVCDDIEGDDNAC